MSKVDDLLAVAASQIGYCATEDQEPGSKYGRWMAEVTGEEWLAGPSTEIWWCCMFVSWCLAHADVECAGFPTYNTDIALRNCNGARVWDIYQAQPGDLIIFNWDGNSTTDHIGIVEANFGDWLQTIEGNVFNSVMRVTRDWSCVAAIIRPDFEEFTGDEDIRYMQLMLNVHMQRRGWPMVNPTGEYDWVTMVPLIKLCQEWMCCSCDPTVDIDANWSKGWINALSVHPIKQGFECIASWAVKAALIGKGEKGAELDLSSWSFTPELAQHVRAWQEKHGLPKTGKVDSDTLFELTHEEVE